MVETVKEEDRLDNDEYGTFKKALNLLAQERGEWAGYPMPVDGTPLVMHKRFPYPITGFQVPTPEDPYVFPDELGAVDEGEITFVNGWFSQQRGCIVSLYKMPDGKVVHEVMPQYGGPKMDFWLNTLGASRAWDLEHEERALEKLKSLLKPHQYKYYMLTGTFLETSKRSNVTYLFRKSRPTIALSMKKDTGKVSVLTTLCLHPLGYYKGSWAGVMVPTDDVIAHLLMMRGNEHKFWSKSNSHPLWSSAAGI